MNVVDQIKQLAADGFGAFLPNYRALHHRCIGIRTGDPDRCAEEAQRRQIGAVNIYLAGADSVVCWPLVPAL